MPIVGPLIGGVLGVLIYDWFIGRVLDARERLHGVPDFVELPDAAPAKEPVASR